MAADTLREFLENGHIRNSVNFPDAVLPRESGSIRIAIANSNIPNMVGPDLDLRSPSAGLNIAELLNRSRGEYAYTLIDAEGDRRRGAARAPARDRWRASVRCVPRGIDGWRRNRRRQDAGMQGVSEPNISTGCAEAISTELRAKIDAIDEQLHALLNERARLARHTGISKHQDGHTVDFYRPEREAEVLRRALERNHGPLRNEDIVRVFREIMSACLAQQEPLKVAFLGPEGTFTQSGGAQALRSLGAGTGAQHRR